MSEVPSDDSLQSRLLERVEDLAERVETIEAVDFQQQIAHLNQRLAAAEQTLLDTRRALSHETLLSLVNWVRAWSMREVAINPEAASPLRECDRIITRQFTAENVAILHSDNPEIEVARFREALEELLGRSGFTPFNER